MKSVFFVAMFLILALGCEKFADVTPMESEQLELKKGEIVVPAKCWLTTVLDPTIPFVTCVPEEYGVHIPGGGWMKGHETHGGKLKEELSTWSIPVCYLGPGPDQLTEIVEGTHTVANGDSYFYSGTLTINYVTSALTGEIDINGGTGKYEGATGHLTLTGKQNMELMMATFTGEGFWIFAKK